MKSLKSACKPRATVFDAARRDTVLDLSDLVGDRIKPEEFANEFGKLSRSRGSLVDFFRKSPLANVNLDLARSTDTGRSVDL